MNTADIIIAKLSGVVEFDSRDEFNSNIPILIEHNIIEHWLEFKERIRYRIIFPINISGLNYGHNESVSVWDKEFERKMRRLVNDQQ